MDTVKYKGNEYVIVRDNGSEYTILEKEYLVEFEVVGMDTEGSKLRTENVPGEQVGYIINAETGYGVGFCGILKDDPDLAE